MTTSKTDGVKLRGAVKPGFERILTADALAFVAALERKFGARRNELLAARSLRQKRFDAGELPDFLPETKAIREGDWKIAGIPADLMDRRVEITGPVDNRKMVINALNSGAQSYMTDFEDAAAPTWDNMIGGQINLMDYWDGKIGFTDEANGKTYNSPTSMRCSTCARAAGTLRKPIWKLMARPCPVRCSISVSTSSTMRRS